MKTFRVRIRRLEGQFGLQVENSADQRLWERIEAGRRRIAQWKGECFVPKPYGTPIREEIRGLSVVEILQRGRRRCAQSLVDPLAVTVCAGTGGGSERIEEADPRCKYGRPTDSGSLGGGPLILPWVG